MNREQLTHLPEYNGLSVRSDCSTHRVVETVKVKFKDGAEYALNVVGIQQYSRRGQESWDLVHSTSERNGMAHKDLKFCPIEDLVRYTPLNLVEERAIVGDPKTTF